MKAAQINNYGNEAEIEITEIEVPTITDDQVLVKVAAASLNPFDSTVLAGHAQTMAPLIFPATLGLDIAGTITEIGHDVSGFAVGDRVYGTANAMFGNSGAFAEYAATGAANIGIAPNNSSDSEAAALPTAGISALQALVDSLHIISGQKLFINGGSGGIGSIAIQIAKKLGAYVTVTASTDNIEYVKSLGADKVIDYKSQNYKELIHDYDAVLDTVGGERINGLLVILKKGGVAVTLAGKFDETIATSLGLAVSTQATHVTTKALDALRHYVDDRTISVEIDQTFPLDHTQRAFTVRQTQSIKGKVVITMGE